MHHKATRKLFDSVPRNVVLHIESPDLDCVTTTYFHNDHEDDITNIKSFRRSKDIDHEDNITKIKSICRSKDIKDIELQKSQEVINQDYIMLTEDFLDSFKSKVLKSNNGVFSSDAVEHEGGAKKYHGNRLPPMFAERLRAIEEKANRKDKLKDKSYYRMPTRPDVRISITGCAALTDVTGALTDVLSPISRGPKITRSMESAREERREPHPDDIIDSVAKANSVHIDTGSVLPEIRAAPCPIHTKRERGKGQELMYSSNSHAKSPRRLNPHMISLPQNEQSSLFQSPRKTNRIDLNVKIPEQFPIKPPLPKKLSSKDFVMTWLIHGSAPPGSNHFPGIIQQKSADIKSKTTPRRSELSE